MSERVKSLRKSESDKKHRIYDTLQSIKEAIVKRKYNQAWEQAAKYYEQNKNTLKNEEIFQLSWLSCESINKKVNIPQVLCPEFDQEYEGYYQAHFEHLFSLYCSLHTQLLPEVINHDKAYFGMLPNSEQTSSPISHFPQDLIFYRRESSFFLREEKIEKELRKLMREHLRITNNTLMFKVKKRKEGQSLLQAVKCCEEIFSSVKEHEFPVEMINFELTKLTIIEDLGVKEGIVCNYRLPVGLLGKIYSHLRSNKDEALEHYIKKLISYFVLSFRNCSVSIEEVYIACKQMLYLSRLIKEKSSPNLYHAHDLKKKFNLLKINRQITIEKDHIDENYASRSNKSNISSFSTNNKFSEKKLESKTKIFKPEEHLKSIANAALDKINACIAGRREVIKIALSYFSEVYLRSIKSHQSDQFIEGEVLLKLSRKNKKTNNSAEGNSEEALEKVLRKEGKSLSSLIKKKGLQKKLSLGEEDEEAAFNTQTTNKKQGKFIIKNIQALKLEAKPKNDDLYCKEVEKIINFANQLNESDLMEESSSDEQGNCKHQFEGIRRKQIKELRTCKEGIQVMSLAMNIAKLQERDGVSEQQNLQSSKFNEQRVNSICLLDEVISNTVSNILDIPNNSKRQGKHLHSYQSLSKLDSLRMEIESLNLQRRLLAEDLVRKGEKNQIDSLDITANYFDSSIMEGKDEIAKLGADTKTKIEKYAANFVKLANIEKQNKRAVVLAQPKIKLQINKKGKSNAPELTFARLQEEYRGVQGIKEDRKQSWDMFLSCQYDKLRRDVSKNQFASQNEKKSSKKGKCETIREYSYEEELL